ncbi:Cytochrome oxidase assembly [Rhizina undulata]
MPTFTSKKFTSSTSTNAFSARYRRALSKNPFLFFGLPFIGTIVAGSFFLTPATALRYEAHDRKVRRVSQDEALGIGKNRRNVDLNEEYYRLAMKDIDNWEQKRVERLKGEPDGIL